MVSRGLRSLVLLGLVAATTYGAAVLGGRGAALGVAGGWLLALGLALVWLPRAAHRAFERGKFARAMRFYRVLRRVLIDRVARSSVDVSTAACALAAGDHGRALALLDRLDPAQMTEAARAAWLNNRAYALARSGSDHQAALVHIDEAIALRPDVAGFRHTRGVVLLGLGRLDEAIRELDDLWSELAGGESPTSSLLEAERCFDLGTAWNRKGEREYAVDYFERARKAAPSSSWADLAAAELAETRARREPAGLAELPGLAELIER